MYLFKTKGGAEHLGYPDIIVNPCGDYNNTNDVINGFRVWYSDRFFTESEITESRKLPSLIIESDGLSRQPSSYIDAISTQSLLGMSSRELLARIESIIIGELPNIIKAWVLLNCECNSSIVIGPDASVSSKGELKIKTGAKIPLYIHIKQ